MTLTALPGGGGRPPEPDWTLIYSDEDDIEAASQEWRTIVNEMQTAGTLAVANGHAIQRLVAFRLIYEKAARDVAEQGAITKAKRTAVPQYNPCWIVMRQADDSIRALEGELGVAPAKRGRAAKAPRRKTGVTRPSDAYMRRKPDGKE